MRCFPFFHDYKLEDCFAFYHFYTRKTRMLYICQKCGKIKVKTIEGGWKINRDEAEQRENEIQEESE